MRWVCKGRCGKASSLPLCHFLEHFSLYKADITHCFDLIFKHNLLSSLLPHTGHAYQDWPSPDLFFSPSALPPCVFHWWWWFTEVFRWSFLLHASLFLLLLLPLLPSSRRLPSGVPAAPNLSVLPLPRRLALKARGPTILL